MYQLQLTVNDHATRWVVVCHLYESIGSDHRVLLAESGALQFLRSENTSLDPFQAILEIAADAARSMSDSGFQPRYSQLLF